MAESTQIYIRGFPRSTRQQQLKKAFHGFGDIKEVKMLGSYAFVTYCSPEDASQAVKSMEGSDFDGQKLKVEIAGKPKRLKGPQPDDVCRGCGKQGHWKNGCPQFKRDKYRERKRRSRSQSSSSSSQSRDRHRKSKRKRKSKKISKKNKKRSVSSDSYSSSSGSSQSSRSSSQSEKEQRQKKKEKKKSSDRKRE